MPFGYEVLMAVAMNDAVVWVVTPYEYSVPEVSDVSG
jgi:hypothetical protein